MRRADSFTSKNTSMDSGKNNQIEKGEFAVLLSRRTGWHPETCRAFVEAFFYLVKDILAEGKDVCFQNIGEFKRHLQPAQDFGGVAEGTSKPERYLAKFYSHEKLDAYLNGEPEKVEDSEWVTPPLIL